MGKSKYDHHAENSKPEKGDRKSGELGDGEAEYGRHKSKKSGKRFHRKKTLRDEYWDKLPGED
jgi:hypothetical protein